VSHVILEGVVGSRAHGLATPTSDTDILGVFLSPTSALVGLRPPPETITGNDPDRCYHELGKFVHLAVAANPTVLELLWLDEYTTQTNFGERLVLARDAFLSNRVRKTYVGYAWSQCQRLERRVGGSLPDDARKRIAKYARHICRLLIQAEGLLLTGRLHVRLTADEAVFCRSMGDLATKLPDEFVDMTESRIDHINTLPSLLPDEPDIATIDALLREVRKAYW
jgi:uncharacterized protein